MGSPHNGRLRPARHRQESTNDPEGRIALVGNKSAVGEQYVELQPQTDGGPYLKDGSTIAPRRPRSPCRPTEILTNLSNLGQLGPEPDLRTVVSESGAAFNDAGPSIGQIIDTSSSFIDTANANFDVTTALIRDSRVVLQTQVDKGSAIRKLLPRPVAVQRHRGRERQVPPVPDRQRLGHRQPAAHVPASRTGSTSGQLINNLVTTNEMVVKHLKGIRQLLVIYPYVVAGGFTVAEKNRRRHYDARFGLILQQDGTRL